MSPAARSTSPGPPRPAPARGGSSQPPRADSVICYDIICCILKILHAYTRTYIYIYIYIYMIVRCIVLSHIISYDIIVYYTTSRAGLHAPVAALRHDIA